MRRRSPACRRWCKTFTIPDPSAYLRTVFIEALAAAGVAVAAPAVGPNPADRLPDGYADGAPGSASWSRRATRNTPG